MKRFLRDTRGYALVLTLVFLPAFLGITLLMIDIGRGNNAQTDHQAAADALALAAARELDGAADSITRAQAAMENVTNTVAYLARSGEDTLITLDYPPESGVTITVIFLRNIPASDDDPINQAWITSNATTNGREARYVYVRTQARDLDGFFFNPLNFIRPSTPVGATAVATYRASACNVTPLFICNPWEGEAIGNDLQASFEQGKLHGRLLRLVPKGDSTAKPGNFGFLAATDENGNVVNGANELRELFAGKNNAVCYDRDSGVTTQTGRIASLADGLNTRFDIYQRSFRPTGQTPLYPPAENVRKGWIAQTTGNSVNACNQEPTTDLTWTRPFGNNVVMAPPGQVDAAPGAEIGGGSWDFAGYWAVNHPGIPQPDLQEIGSRFLGTLPDQQVPPAAVAPGATGLPSRYEVYRYEIQKGRGTADWRNADRSVGNAAGSAGTREDGIAQCASTFNRTPVNTGEADRRVIFAAMINCNRELSGGKNVDVEVEAYASVFLVNPSTKADKDRDDLGDRSIDVEIVDITGASGNGTLETFLREEAFLVR